MHNSRCPHSHPDGVELDHVDQRHPHPTARFVRKANNGNAFPEQRYLLQPDDAYGFAGNALLSNRAVPRNPVNWKAAILRQADHHKRGEDINIIELVPIEGV